MNTDTEVTLFHVHDPAPALHFSDVSNETLFNLCVRSIRARSPHSRITLLTDGKTEIGSGYPDILIIRDPALDTQSLMYERSRMYSEHIARRASEGDPRPLIFMDIDILVNRDLGDVFRDPFDVGLTYRVPPGVSLDANGIPVNTQVSPINGGVIFARPNSASAGFFAEQMARYRALHAQGRIANKMVADIRKWGGDQFALMNMVGRELIEKRPQEMRFAGAHVRFFDCDTYNFSPDDGMRLDSEILKDKFILHMKGPRKRWMPDLARWMRIP